MDCNSKDESDEPQHEFQDSVPLNPIAKMSEHSVSDDKTAWKRNAYKLAAIIKNAGTAMISLQ